jgi:hypothetical protein
MTDGRPQTVAELMALPITGFGMEIHKITDADRARGYIVISGRRAEVRRGVNSTGFVVMPADAVEVWHTDEMGVTWGLALHESGKWFRKQK